VVKRGLPSADWSRVSDVRQRGSPIIDTSNVGDGVPRRRSANAGMGTRRTVARRRQREGVVDRVRVPSASWLLSGGFGLALLLLAAREVALGGHLQFFNDGDSAFYLLTARLPFANASAFARMSGEIPYRYGRVGFPLTAWLLALGRPGLVPWSMIAVYLASLAAIPGLAATLLAEYQVPPFRAVFVLLTPGLLLATGLVYAEALQVALILLACLFEVRSCRRAALVTLAFAVLVKETSILALLPWLGTATKRRDARQLLRCVAVAVPYALWCLWVRIRIGEFPFLARTGSRTGALRPPLIGFRDALHAHSPNHSFIVTVTLLTFLLGVLGSWSARRYWIAPITAAFTTLIPCYGPSALYYVIENLRLLSVPTVLAILCLVTAFSSPAGLTRESEVRHNSPRT